MAKQRFVLIAADLWNELENELGEPGDLEILLDYGDSLRRAAASLDDSLMACAVGEQLEAAEKIRASLEDGSLGLAECSELDSELLAELLGGLCESTELLGDILVPLAGEGYDPQMDLGRLDADQIPDYSPARPVVELAGVRYSVITVA